MTFRNLMQGTLAVALLAFLPLGAAAQDSSSAQALLDAIYKPYLSKDFQGTDYFEAPVTRSLFAPELAEAILKDGDEANKRNEVPNLDGDPFLDAQDWEISNLKIAVKSNGPDRATGSVTFTNFDKPTAITIELIKTANGWRVAEIKAPSGSLRALYKLK